MPITLNSVTLEYKSLPLLLSDDGSATITIRKGYMDNGVFQVINTTPFSIPAEDVAAILDAPPLAGLTRRDDLSLAIYQHLVNKGLVEAGTIS